MSSTSNAQDLLVNVFRPTYHWDPASGFTPSLVVSNVTELIAGSIKTDKLAVTDSNANTYIGSNAGPLLNVTTTASNTAIGYNAMAGASSSSNNVSIGSSNFAGLANGNSNVGLGANTRITGSGQKNILIGANLTLGTGSGNIVIGNDLSLGTISNTFRLGSLLYGDLSQGYIGINTPTPQAPLDISGIVLFRNKVGFQNPNPVYSLDVAGSIYASERYLAGRGTLAAPIFAFADVSGTGFYQPTDASYGVGAIGLAVGSSLRGVVMSNKTVLYGGLDVCGTVTSSGGSASFLAGPGSVTEPAYSFSGSSNLGLYRTTDASGTAVGIAIGGTSRLVVGSNKVTILGNFDVCGTLSAASGGGGGGSGTIAADGAAATPSFTFSNDLTTGLYLQSASNLGFSTGGVRRMTILNTGDVSAGQLIVSQYLRNTTNGTRTLDISGGNISNSGTHTASNFSGTSAASNQIGGVTLSNTNISYAGALTGSTASASNQIGGVTLSNTNISYAGAISNTTAASSNTIGGVTLSNSRLVTTNGTVAAPAVCLADASTGFYRPNAAAGIYASLAGVRALGITSNLFEFSNRGVQTLWLTDNQLQASAGSVGTPSYAYAGDASLGFYRIGSGQLGFTTAGENRMTLSNANLGIGKAPAFALDVSGSANIQAGNGTGALYVGGSSTGVIIQRDAGGNGYVRALGSGVNLYLGTSNSNTMTILSTGLVGIGTTAPGASLDISGGVVRAQRAFTGNANGFVLADSTGTLTTRWGLGIFNAATGSGSGGNDFVINSYDDSLAITQPLTIKRSNGYVGLATTNPQAALDVSTAGGTTIRATNGKGLFDVIFGGISSEYASTSLNGYFSIYKANTTNKAASNLMVQLSPDAGAPCYILSNNVGIGLSNPSYTLDVSGTVRATSFTSSNLSTSLLGGVGIANRQVAIGTGTFGSTFMVAVGEGTNTLAYSTDSGVTWTGLGTSIFSTIAYDVAWNGSIWVAGGSGTNALAYSYDGINWTGVGTSILSAVRGVAWSGTRWVAVGNGTFKFAYSSDGITWTGSGSTVFSVGGNFVRYGGGQFVAAGDGSVNTIATSADGITWTGQGKVVGTYATCVAYNGSLWVATGVGTTDTIYTSANGTSWTGRTITGGQHSWSVAWNGSSWIVGAQGTTKIFTSTDATTWTGRSTTNFGTVVGLSWNGTYWVAGTTGTTKLATSTDGVTWTARDTGTIFSSGSWFSASQRYALPIIGSDGLAFDASGENVRIMGRLGIGMTPTYALQLSTDSAAKPSTNTWTISSDRRIKQDIRRADTSLCYDVIKRLPLQRFTWDASYMPNVPDKKSVGWIAQDVMQVFPNAVSCVSNAWFDDFHGLDVDQLYKTMYGALEKVIADKEALETKFTRVLARLAALEAAAGLTVVDVSETVMDASGIGMDVSGTVMDASETVMDVSGVVMDVSETAMDVSGVVMDVSETVMDVSGIGMDVSGIGMDASGIGIDVSGIGMDVSGIGMDVSDVMMDASGIGMDVSETAMDVSGTVMDVSGTVMDASETAMDVSGTVMDASETAMDVSGGMMDASETGMDASETGMDVSGSIMDVSGASPQSSELTPSTPPTPPTPSESAPPESQPEPQPQSSSEYAPAPEASEA